MVSSSLVYEKDKCCGCGLCAKKCPKKAIEMREDECGFIFPFINRNKCIDCGICKSICPYNEKRKTNDFGKISYAAVSKDSDILNTSASGGVFTSVALKFIENGGIVYGCSLETENNNFAIKHIRVDNKRDLAEIKGSKYVQSNISDVFEKIKDDINLERNVLFSGTPCQVSAIKKFVGNSNHLYTMDIICHGVPNSKMFNDYINYVNEVEKIKIKKFNFRDKSKGWGMFYNYSYFDEKKGKNKIIVKPSFKSSFFQLFLDSFTYRENCYSCPFACETRISDITIGDFWGIEKEHDILVKKGNITPFMGVSCVVVNSEKGRFLLENYFEYISLFDSDFNKIKIYNGQLNSPSKRQKDREKILEDYRLLGYKSVERYYHRKNRIKNMAKNIWYMIPYDVRRKLK